MFAGVEPVGGAVVGHEVRRVPPARQPGQDTAGGAAIAGQPFLCIFFYIILYSLRVLSWYLLGF